MRLTLIALSVATLVAVPTHAQQIPDTPDSVKHVNTIPDYEVDAIGGVSNNYLVTDDFVVHTAFEVDGDLNGDGDQADKVLHVWQQQTGLSLNLGYSTPGNSTHFNTYKIGGDDLIFLAGEGNQGNIDLNGDSDASDEVLHLADLNTGAVTNLGLAGINRLRMFHVDQGWFAAGVNEWDQGKVDLNGDGDTLDYVAFVGDTATATLTSTGLAMTTLSPMELRGSLLGVVLRESDGNGDLNGDGDQADSIFVTYDIATGVLTNTQKNVNYFVWHSSGLAQVSVSEAGEGADLNGDGDMTDLIWHLWNPQNGIFINLGFEAFGQKALIGDTFAAFQRSEVEELVDLNGDGDMTDEVVSVHDLPTGTVTNLGLATDSYMVLEDTVLVIAVYEWHQGATDLNGDGDAFDRVGFVYHHFTGVATNTGVAIGNSTIEDGVVGFHGWESYEGRDLNGDGDTGDFVFHTYDIPTQTVKNWKIACDSSALWSDKGLICAFADEKDHRKILNLDADRKDEVLLSYEVATGKLTDYQHAVYGPYNISVIQTLAPRQLFQHVSEWQQGRDMNGDGDLFDGALMRFRPD